MGMQPDQNEFFYIVVISGGAGSGLFVYNPVPGAGSLIASIAGQAGTDAYGNAVLQGVAGYSASTGQASAIDNSGAFRQFLGPVGGGGPWTVAFEIVTAPGATTLATLQAVMQFEMSGGNVVIVSPSGDKTGVTDRAAITAALALGGASPALLTPGQFYLSSQVTVAGTELAGCGMGTVISPGTGYAGALLAAGAKGSIRNLTVQGSGSDAITVAGGVAEWWLHELNFASNTGFCVNATITGPAHGDIRHIRGQGGGAANGGGIRIDGGTGGAITAEINIDDIDIQNCLTSAVLYLSAVTDIRFPGAFNGSCAGTNTSAGAIQVQGACQSINLGDIDVGAGGCTAGLLVQDAGGFSPSEVQFGPGVLQSGAGAGVIVSGGAARLSFDRLWAKRFQGDGWLLTNTGAFNRMSGCGGNLNNQAAWVAYDVDVAAPGTGHWLNDGFSYVSGGVTAGRSLVAGNHYTEASPPSALTTAGAAPGGW